MYQKRMKEFMEELTSQEWEAFINQHPEAHLLQTPTWGELKSHFGWQPHYFRQGECGAMVLFRPLPLGFSVAYIPRGPLGENWSSFWPEIDDVCRKERAVFLRVEPDIWQPEPDDFIDKHLSGFTETDQSIQPPRTILINIEGSEDQIMDAMKSKTRYNIRLAERKHVEVVFSDDADAFHQMMLTTGERDEFGIHSLAYYRKAYELFAPKGKCALLIARFNGEPLAGLMAFAQGNTAWYFYGASTNQERNRMPTYLLQWEAMRWAKQKGCKTYDLWGVPDFSETALENTFLERSDGLWGVYRFKRGFGGEVRRTIGTFDRIYQPALYRLYQLWSKRRKTPAG
jgi:lipid II:glycine glycyltransferase (peptidoglycan interpeptide bridge formation enzyme)